MKYPEQAIILCGGIGKRLRPITYKVPKPLAIVNQKPFLEYLICQLKDQGIKKILLLTGYKSDLIRNFVQCFDAVKIQINISEGDEDWDTGKRIYEARNEIESNFILLYGDNFSPFSLKNVFKKNLEKGTAACLTIHKKNNGNIKINRNGLIEVYDVERKEEGLNYVEVGYMHVIKERLMREINKDESLSYSINKLAQKKLLSYIENDCKYQSISDPKRLKLTAAHLATKKIILIDRDGTINKRPKKMEYIKSWEELELIDSSVEAMSKLSQHGFKFIIISNQAGIARGILTLEDVNYINKKLKENLEKKGIEIIDFIICPHHWDENCNCRKPKPGMLFTASDKYNFCLNKTIFIGDDIRDAYAASNAGAKSILIGSEFINNKKLNNKITKTCLNLNKMVDWIISFYSD